MGALGVSPGLAFAQAGPLRAGVLWGALPEGGTALTLVEGAQPGERVHLASSSALGAGPCHVKMGGQCLGLAPPIQYVGSTYAHSFGFSFLFAPVTEPAGSQVCYQLVALRGPSGVYSELSEPICRVVCADADLDGECDALDPPCPPGSTELASFEHPYSKSNAGGTNGAPYYAFHWNGAGAVPLQSSFPIHAEYDWTNGSPCDWQPLDGFDIGWNSTRTYIVEPVGPFDGAEFAACLTDGADQSISLGGDDYVPWYVGLESELLGLATGPDLAGYEVVQFVITASSEVMYGPWEYDDATSTYYYDAGGTYDYRVGLDITYKVCGS